MEEKQWYGKAWDWLKDTSKSQKVFETVSAFAMAVGNNAAVQGFFSDDFNIKDLFSWTNLIVGFTGGFGVVAVQEDAMRKATIKFEETNELWNKYNSDNIDKAYNLRNSDFQRWFTKQLNDNELQDAVEKATTSKINSLKNEIYHIENTLRLTKKSKLRNKLNNKLTSLNFELDDLEKNGLNPMYVAFKMYMPSDIFAFNEDDDKIGVDKIKDNSLKEQRRKNLLARFYMPLLSMLITNGIIALLSNAIVPVVVSSLTFLLLLVWVWYSSYRVQTRLRIKNAITKEANLNTILTDATNQYDDWKQKQNTLHVTKEDGAVVIKKESE